MLSLVCDSEDIDAPFNFHGGFRKMRLMADSRAVVSLILAASVFGVLILYAGSRGSGDALRSSDDLSKLEERISTRLQAQMLTEMQTAVTGQYSWPPVKPRSADQQLRILVTGGAGFVGSHLVDVLMMKGHVVYVLDNLFTGRKKNIQHWIGHPNFHFFQHDVVEPFMSEVDQIYHLACPASPPHYQYNPIKTIKTSTQGTLNMLGLAKRVGARLLLASTSEVYGDPLEHPQTESYRGNVNTMGPRACYDEGKRVGETMCYAYREQSGVEVRIARIFNTFGPRMHPNDGRVVSNFIIQALNGKPITIYGSGEQTRSFQYVSDLVRGLILLMNGEYDEPVNIGNPDEYSIADFARKIKAKIGGASEIKYMAASKDDPQQRRPDISTGIAQIGWQPKTSVDDGLSKAIEYFTHELQKAKAGDKMPVVWMPVDLITDEQAGQPAGPKVKTTGPLT